VAELVGRYIQLALRVGKHDEDLIDSYYGPQELTQRVEAEEPRDPAALVEDVQALAEDAAGDEWLVGQVEALGANAQTGGRAARLRRGGPAGLWHPPAPAGRGAVPPRR
jgi:hypothetical protein